MNGVVDVLGTVEVLRHVVHWLEGDAVVGPLAEGELLERADAAVGSVRAEVVLAWVRSLVVRSDLLTD